MHPLMAKVGYVNPVGGVLQISDSSGVGKRKAAKRDTDHVTLLYADKGRKISTLAPDNLGVHRAQQGYL